MLNILSLFICCVLYLYKYVSLCGIQRSSYVKKVNERYIILFYCSLFVPSRFVSVFLLASVNISSNCICQHRQLNSTHISSTEHINLWPVHFIIIIIIFRNIILMSNLCFANMRSNKGIFMSISLSSTTFLYCYCCYSYKLNSRCCNNLK